MAVKDKPPGLNFDGETQTNWKTDGHTGYKAGFLFGRMRNRRGTWIKVEVWHGPQRVATLAIKTSFFKVH